MTIKHLYPSQRPSLDLNFARTKRLDPRVTFTRGSTATYVGNDGLIKTAVDNEPRFDHDPVTGESLGLLVEEERVNSLRYSQDFTDALWVKTSATIIPNSVIAPDGTLTGSTMKANAGTAILPSVIQNAGDAAIRTLSLYAKMGTYRYLKINPRVNQYALVVDLQDGSVYATGNTGVVSADIIPAPNGWYRLILTTDVTAPTRTFAIRFSTNANNNSTFDFDGTETVHIWGAQLETGAFPTSYIPTTSSTVTRAADVASITGSNFSSWYNQSEGTVFAEGVRNFTISSEFPRMLSFGTAGSNAQLIDILGVSGDDRLEVAALGIAQALLQISPDTAAFTRSSYAAALKNNNFAFTRNGAAVVTDTSGTVPAVSQLRIGDRQDGVRTHNGTIRRLTYWPTRLSNDTLQTITV